jgi:DNA topoisomerase-1
MKLFIVESPGKVKKIQSFLGDEFKVTASVGHIRQLKKDDYFDETTFTPKYDIIEDKEKVVRELRSLAKASTMVYLCADLDREGEAIAESCRDLLNLKTNEYERVTFNEITKAAILDALKKPRKMDTHLVNAQVSRALLDQIVGFKLTQQLYKRISKAKLSVGRVQTVAVRLVADKEDEVIEFLESNKGSFYNVTGNFKIDGKSTLKTSLYDGSKMFETSDHELVKQILPSFQKAYSISKIESKTRTQNPSPPFITSSLQQTASSKYKYPVKKTMMIAQKLYEGGHITYMRTDCPTMSQQAHNEVKGLIGTKFGDNYYQFNQYASKSASSQEAHECIRPTHFEVLDVDGTPEEKKLYGLIWKRTVASQMKPALFDVLVITIKNESHAKYSFIGSIETLKFDGFLRVYDLGDENDDEVDEENEEKKNVLKNPIEKSSKISLVDLVSQEKIKEPPSRYTEANIVKQLEKMEIGRPSTYASIIDKIQSRGYVEIKNIDGIKKMVKTFKFKTELKTETKEIAYGKEKTKFVPTELGYQVLEFMETYFPYIVDYEFTKGMEKKLDEIANGKMTKVEVMSAFYKKLMLEITKIAGEKITKVVLNTDKLIGNEGDIAYYITKTKFGDAIKWDEDGKTNYKSLKNYDSSLTTLTLDSCLQFIKYPIDLGENIKIYKNFKNGTIYIGLDKKFFTITDENITLEDAKKIIADGGTNNGTGNSGGTGYGILKELNKDIKLGRSKYGYYLIFNKKFYKAPNEKVTLAEAKKIIDAVNNASGDTTVVGKTKGKTKKNDI